ncbi:MAG: Cof-type HAD-IIB family hydrolase [Acholeplasmataceae bacterium]|nr:Cof-type HAD-IIB family hydrolase [Acholeplasmataceae bacterium]
MGKDIDLVKLNPFMLAVFDLDGTLLNSKSRLSDNHINALIAAKQKGMKIVVASGRIYPMLESYIKKIGVVDFVISANGASIDQVSNQRIIKQIYIDQIEAKMIVEFCHKNQIECLILKREMSYYPAQSKRLEKFLNYNHISKVMGYDAMELTQYDTSFSDFQHIEKLLINEKNESEVQKLIDFIKSNTNLQYTKSGKLLLDISSRGVSKEIALKKVCDDLSIGLNQVVAFGDYDNDIGMIKTAGLGVAPQNASKNTLDAADYVTLSNDEDGVSVLINKLIELGKI